MKFFTKKLSQFRQNNSAAAAAFEAMPDTPNQSMDDDENAAASASAEQVEKPSADADDEVRTIRTQRSSSILSSFSGGDDSPAVAPVSSSGSSSTGSSNGEDDPQEADMEQASSMGRSSSERSSMPPPVEVQAAENGHSIILDGAEDLESSQVVKRNRRAFFCLKKNNCLSTWTRRERILLATVGFCGLLIVILFSTNMALVRQKKEATSVAAASSVACGGVSSNADRPWSGGGSWEDNGNSGSGAATSAPQPDDPSASGGGDNSGATDTGSDGNAGGNPNFDPYMPPANIFEGDAAAPPVGDPDAPCGCPVCTESIWNNNAGEFTCGERITYLATEMSSQYPTQVSACRRIAFEFPCDCGGCDPGRCALPTPQFVLPAAWEPEEGTTPAPTPVTAYTDPNLNQEDQELYCFPSGQRQTYTLWGGMRVQIKQDDSMVCGPGNNRFTTETVQIDESADKLTLQYKNGVASEVRILLPEAQRPFTYGKYSFSVESVSVKDASGSVLSSVLPKELVLGLFTWDDTESYMIHENYNHEVDIEISRWGCEANSDLQFLVQPPGFPQMHRLFTGDPTSEDGKYSQGGQVYSFEWNPGQIYWDTSAGMADNNEFYLKTDEAVYRNVPDYVQCLPDIGGNMEIRLNLWNMLGANKPAGLQDSDVVEVVFNSVSFTPSGLTHLPDGSICTKHCHCAATSECISHVCTSTV